MKRVLCVALTLVMITTLLVGCGSGKKVESWKVTCPWAPSGVASMVSQKAAAKSSEHSDSITLVAEAIKGDTATVNTWVVENKANDPELIFISEGMLSITDILDPARKQFDRDDFVFVENLYSSVFVMSADAKLDIHSIEDLKNYVETAEEISVAVNGATGSEAFLSAALFGSMGAGEKLKLTPYKSAAEAAQAVSRGETDFAVSHQSQILESFEQKNVTVVCAFDENAIQEGPFAGVEGVGQHGYPYFKNRCLIMARKGTDADKVAALKALYDDILADQEVVDWLNNTMLLEADTMSDADVTEHLANVRSIVEQYKDIVVH